ncbi:MAG: twin-arginine translocase subunit TatC [Hyphomicrobiales bacterium]|nr:twin-arginine translocase subunit TatC [Hyphomicrobiales bacterium]
MTKKTKPASKAASEEAPSAESMSMTEHLQELRNRLVVAILAWLLGFAVTYGFAEQVYQFLAAPLADIYAGQESRRMIYTGLAEGFITYLKLAMFSGFILAFPVIAAQLYFFVAPGLYKRERRVMLPFLLFSPLVFLCGAALAYYGVFPLAWKFFTGFEMRGADGLPIILEARISEYLSY